MRSWKFFCCSIETHVNAALYSEIKVMKNRNVQNMTSGVERLYSICWWFKSISLKFSDKCIITKHIISGCVKTYLVGERMIVINRFEIKYQGVLCVNNVSINWSVTKFTTTMESTMKRTLLTKVMTFLLNCWTNSAIFDSSCGSFSTYGNRHMLPGLTNRSKATCS